MASNQTNLLILDESALVEVLSSFSGYARDRIYVEYERTQNFPTRWCQEFAREKFAEREQS